MEDSLQWSEVDLHGRRLLDVHFLAEYTPVFAFLIIVLCICFIREYADRKQYEIHNYPTIFLAYFCSVSIMFLSPADLALTIRGRHHHTEEDRVRYLNYTSSDLKTIYATLVYCSIALNPILFFQEFYTVSGYHAVSDRIVDTVKRLSKIGFAFLIFSLVILLVLTQSGNYAGTDAIRVWLTSVQNVYGLFIIVFLLGYGLVEFPKAVWFAGSFDRRLNQKEASVALAMQNLETANFAMVKLIGDVLRTRDHFDRNGDAELAEFMDAVVDHCPEKLMGKKNRQGRALLGENDKITKHSLATLHTRIIKGRANYNALQGRVERLKQTVRNLHDIKNSELREDGVQKITWSLGRAEGSHLEWLWHIKIKDPFCKVSSIIFATLSFTVVMSELGMMAGKSAEINWWYMALNDSRNNAASVIFLSLIPLTYITFLVFWSLFRMRLPGMMIMVNGQQSSPKSMSFVARRAVGIAAPLIYLFYGMIFEADQTNKNLSCSSDDEEAPIPKKCFVTAFTRYYGGMDDSSVVGDFNVFFPVVTFIILLVQAFNGFNLLFVMLGKAEWQFGDEIVEKDIMDKARKKMERENTHLNRAVKRAAATANYKRRRSSLQQAVDRISGDGGPVSAAVRLEAQRKPDIKEGFLEKQSPKHGIPAALKNWQHRYFILSDPGTLKYYHKQPTDPHEEPLGSVDLRLALNMNLHVGKHTGLVNEHRIDIDTADRKFKIRCTTAQESSESMDAILAWHDYAIDNLAFHPPDHYIDDDDDAEQGLGGQEFRHEVSSGDILPLDSTTSPLHPGLRLGGAESPSVKERMSILRRTSIGGSVRPRELEGLLLKKPKEKHWYSKAEGWSERYFRVNPDEHRLMWYKNDFDVNKAPKGKIDLLLVKAIENHKSKIPDPTRFDIDMGDYRIRLKAPSPTEAKRWKEQLEAWQEWLLLHTDHMSFDGDL